MISEPGDIVAYRVGYMTHTRPYVVIAQGSYGIVTLITSKRIWFNQSTEMMGHVAKISEFDSSKLRRVSRGSRKNRSEPEECLLCLPGRPARDVTSIDDIHFCDTDRAFFRDISSGFSSTKSKHFPEPITDSRNDDFFSRQKRSRVFPWSK